MGNLSSSLKKFLQNKNTVTVLGAILCIFILYFVYTYKINSALSPIVIPYAVTQIPSGTQITEEMIDTVEVSPFMLKGEVIQNIGEIVDKYTAADTVIPMGSYFYKRSVVEKEQLPANIILSYPKGYVLYNLAVDTDSTYGNSVYPGNYIDIYLKAVYAIPDDAQNLTAEDIANKDKVMYGQLLQNIKVLAVKDAEGQPVFQNIDENRKPAMVVFALPKEYYILLKKAAYMRSFDTELVLVPTNESLKDEPGDLKNTSTDLKEWIERMTYWTEN